MEAEGATKESGAVLTLITGSGRSRTSFLVRLLYNKGYDVSYNPDTDDTEMHMMCGPYFRLWDDPFRRVPAIVKSPKSAMHVREHLRAGNIRPDRLRLVMPIRDDDEVRASHEYHGLPLVADPGVVAWEIRNVARDFGVELHEMCFYRMNDPMYLTEELSKWLPNIVVTAEDVAAVTRRY